MVSHLLTDGAKHSFQMILRAPVFGPYYLPGAAVAPLATIQFAHIFRKIGPTPRGAWFWSAR